MEDPHRRAYKNRWYQNNKEHCQEYFREYCRNWTHRKGIRRPMNEAKDCSSYLGVYIAERVLSKFFDNITRMPYGNSGYDFICGKGFKVDVKSACLRKYPRRSWEFNIGKNNIANYFLCLAFDSRESLEPQHIWLIPSRVINHKTALCISNLPKSLSKWNTYEKPLDKVLFCCNKIKSDLQKEHL